MPRSFFQVILLAYQSYQLAKAYQYNTEGAETCGCSRTGNDIERFTQCMTARIRSPPRCKPKYVVQVAPTMFTEYCTEPGKILMIKPKVFNHILTAIALKRTVDSDYSKPPPLCGIESIQIGSVKNSGIMNLGDATNHKCAKFIPKKTISFNSPYVNPQEDPWMRLEIAERVESSDENAVLVTGIGCTFDPRAVPGTRYHFSYARKIITDDAPEGSKIGDFFRRLF